MSITPNKENTGLTQKGSTLQQCSSQTAYKFYSSKYDNMINFLESILDDMEKPDEGLHSWLSRLKTLNFDLFISILESKLGHDNVDKAIVRFADDEGFSLERIKPDDLHKIKRYIALFQSMF